MQLQVILNHDLSLEHVLDVKKKSKKEPYLLRGPLINLPTRNILNWHSKEWVSYEYELETSQKILSNVITKYGKDIINLIPKTTKIPWQIETVNIVPSIDTGAATDGTIIYFGINNWEEADYLEVLIHELIHINIKSKLAKLKKILKQPRDSEEIVVVLLSNKIIHKLNEKNDLKLPDAVFLTWQRDLLKGNENNLKDLSNTTSSFEELIIKVDQYLGNKKIKGYFSNSKI